MTIDEAIRHCEEVAEKMNDCECAADHRQLAEWLRELKELREENKVLISECDRLIKEKGELLSKVSGGQPVKRCRMIPLEPDCRGCTDVFICTNCHQHIHLGFIRKEYSGSYCLECGAEVKDDDT